MQQTPESKVFISYRREDTSFVAAAVREKLIQHFRPENVFMDVDAIPAGRNFREHLQRAVGECHVVLAFIGATWIDARDDAGGRRLDHENDWVRLELEAALKRDIPVIPVLVGEARMPTVNDLPASLSDLAYRQALSLRQGRDYAPDLERLVREVKRTLAQEKPSPTSESTRPTGHLRRTLDGRSIWLLLAVVVAVFVGSVWYRAQPSRVSTKDGRSPGGPIASSGPESFASPVVDAPPRATAAPRSAPTPSSTTDPGDSAARPLHRILPPLAMTNDRSAVVKYLGEPTWTSKGHFGNTQADMFYAESEGRMVTYIWDMSSGRVRQIEIAGDPISKPGVIDAVTRIAGEAPSSSTKDELFAAYDRHRGAVTFSVSGLDGELRWLGGSNLYLALWDPALHKEPPVSSR
ncbi:TIR domain-containing protein [Candidatus Binatia bacterium]|jgi:hypothetical protein|nr:TIR domain-containing protein [Candidatus Binatia bacterium]